MIVFKCFACGAPTYNPQRPCPKCGYSFTAADTRYCPNMNYGICQITENPCKEGINYALCAIKNKADEESFI